jgi:mRNA interferase MazF
MNKYLDTVLIAPLTSTIKSYPTRVTITIEKRKGQIVLDQIRTVDKIRFIKRVGRLNYSEQQTVKRIIKEMLVDD